MSDVDVAVIGGGAAGLSAGIALARFRRSVVVIDAGEPRNAPADGVHNLLGREGVAPAALIADGQADLASYGGTLRRGEVTTVSCSLGAFTVTLADGTSVTADRLIVTTGLVDQLPDVPGLVEHWGQDVIHCPFCHGWEVRGQRIGVLATDAGMATHQARLFRLLSEDVTVLTHTARFDDDLRTGLLAAGIRIEDGEVTGVGTEGGRLTGVELADGRAVAFDAVVVAPTLRARAGLLADLGLTVVDHPSGAGDHVPSEPGGATTVPGVRVAGNVTDPMAQVSSASAAGTMAAAAVIAELVAAL